ncbi:hypothetical protein BHM03_00022951 [Ensete ventricosum]|nr:hypothetical protein BHM03_00022951 [Ensete ventricosum]
MDPPGCSAFGLLVGRSCDIGPPSSAKNVTKLSGVELRCRLDLFLFECASPPTSVGVKLPAWIDAPSGVLDTELGRLVPRAVSGIAILHTGLFGDGRGDLERPLRCPKSLPFTCCRSKYFIHVGGELARAPSLTFVVPRNMTETYGGRAATTAWGEGMTRHATLMGVG